MCSCPFECRYAAAFMTPMMIFLAVSNATAFYFSNLYRSDLSVPSGVVNFPTMYMFCLSTSGTQYLQSLRNSGNTISQMGHLSWLTTSNREHESLHLKDFSFWTASARTLRSQWHRHRAEICNNRYLCPALSSLSTYHRSWTLWTPWVPFVQK